MRKSRKEIREQAESPQFHVKVNHTVYTTVLHEGSGEWDGDDISYSHSFDGYTVSEEKGFWDFVFNEDPTGKTLYLVYALYDTGDSFSSTENEICMVALLEHFGDAREIAKAIETDYKNNKDSFNPVTVHLPKSNTDLKVSTGTWKGYFEHLREVTVLPLNPSETLKIRI